MRQSGLRALVLGALLARVALPAFHFHEEGGHGGHCRHERHDEGPRVEAAEPECALCELLAVKVPGLEPEPAPRVGPSRVAAVERAREDVTAPRSAVLWIACAPRGPPASSPA